MTIKVCNKCGTGKPLSEFNKRAGSRDGYRGNCKRCHQDTCKAYAKTDVGKKVHQEASRKYAKGAPTKRYLSNKEWRERNPAKYAAHGIVAYAIKKGRLIKGLCECCGEKTVHAHHDDYAKPLEVRWLCSPCHNNWHTENGEALNS